MLNRPKESYARRLVACDVDCHDFVRNFAKSRGTDDGQSIEAAFLRGDIPECLFVERSRQPQCSLNCGWALVLGEVGVDMPYLAGYRFVRRAHAAIFLDKVMKTSKQKSRKLLREFFVVP